MAYNSFYEYLTALNGGIEVSGNTSIADAGAILVKRLNSKTHSNTLYDERDCVPNNAMNFHIAIKLILDEDSFEDYKKVAKNKNNKSQESTVTSALTRTLWQSGDKEGKVETVLFSKFFNLTTTTLNDLVDNISKFASSIKISEEIDEIDLSKPVITNKRTMKNKAEHPTYAEGEANDIITSYKTFLLFFTGKVIDITSSPQATQSTIPTIDKLKDLLQQKGQIILKGPPGTGKTRLAQLVAEEIALKGCDPLKTQKENIKNTQTQREIIQFHPSYSYEDFIMGLEVSTDGGNIKYEMKSRGIKAFADLASLRKWQNFVLIIDEINRAPVSSVFGELMYALEYRGEEITLSSGETMTLPKNLYIIGTMNTADRSIAELDYAMQRRFDFVEIPPTVPSDLDDKHFAQNLYDSIQKIFKRENIMTGIDPKDVQLGTSYFIYDGTDEHLNYKINYQIIPLLREYYKDGVFRKKQIMFGELTFQDYFQGNKMALQKELYKLGGIQ